MITRLIVPFRYKNCKASIQIFDLPVRGSLAIKKKGRSIKDCVSSFWCANGGKRQSEKSNCTHTCQHVHEHVCNTHRQVNVHNKVCSGVHASHQNNHRLRIVYRCLEHDKAQSHEDQDLFRKSYHRFLSLDMPRLRLIAIIFTKAR